MHFEQRITLGRGDKLSAAAVEKEAYYFVLRHKDVLGLTDPEVKDIEARRDAALADIKTTGGGQFAGLDRKGPNAPNTQQLKEIKENRLAEKRRLAEEEYQAAEQRVAKLRRRADEKEQARLKAENEERVQVGDRWVTPSEAARLKADAARLNARLVEERLQREAAAARELEAQRARDAHAKWEKETIAHYLPRCGNNEDCRRDAIDFIHKTAVYCNTASRSNCVEFWDRKAAHIDALVDSSRVSTRTQTLEQTAPQRSYSGSSTSYNNDRDRDTDRYDRDDHDRASFGNVPSSLNTNFDRR